MATTAATAAKQTSQRGSRTFSFSTIGVVSATSFPSPQSYQPTPSIMSHSATKISASHTVPALLVPPSTLPPRPTQQDPHKQSAVSDSPRLPRPATQVSTLNSFISLSSSSEASEGESDSETVVSASDNAHTRADPSANTEGEGDVDSEDEDDELTLPAHPSTAASASPFRPYGHTYRGRNRISHDGKRTSKAAAASTAATAKNTTTSTTVRITHPNPTQNEHEDEIEAETQDQDPSCSYTRIIRFSPPRSSSSYRLHDYVVSSSPPPRRPCSPSSRAATATPPVPRVNWPLPAGGLPGNEYGGVGNETGERRGAGDNRRSLSAGITALPVRYMEEVYRPKPRVRAATAFGVIADSAGAVAAAGNSKAALEKEGRKERGFRERLRGWLRPAAAAVKKGENEGDATEKRQGSEASAAAKGEEEEDEDEEIDFLEALRTTSPGLRGSRIVSQEPNRTFAAARNLGVGVEAKGAGHGRVGNFVGAVDMRQFEKGDFLPARGGTGEEAGESEVSRLRRENEALKRENELLRLWKENKQGR